VSHKESQRRTRPGSFCSQLVLASFMRIAAVVLYSGRGYFIVRDHGGQKLALAWAAFGGHVTAQWPTLL
jgi:hypothetical protein